MDIAKGWEFTVSRINLNGFKVIEVYHPDFNPTTKAYRGLLLGRDTKWYYGYSIAWGEV